MELYLLLMLANSYTIIIARAFEAPVHGKDVVGVLRYIGKHYL